MRKAVGPLLKACAFLILIALIGVINLIASTASSFGMAGANQAYLYIGVALVGFFLFLLLYAQGQSVQSLVEIAENQAETRNALKEIALLLRERPIEAPYEPRPMFAPEPAHAQPAKDWRRPAPAAPAPAPVSRAPKPKVACSLCGAVQDAGQASCHQCGATFVTGASL